MLPPPSNPMATGTTPRATATAEPPEEPPEWCEVLYGLNGPPCATESVAGWGCAHRVWMGDV